MSENEDKLRQNLLNEAREELAHAEDALITAVEAIAEINEIPIIGEMGYGSAGQVLAELLYGNKDVRPRLRDRVLDKIVDRLCKILIKKSLDKDEPTEPAKTDPPAAKDKKTKKQTGRKD